MFQEIIGIKTQISIACLETLFSENLYQIETSQLYWFALHTRNVFRTQSNIYNEAFLRNYLVAQKQLPRSVLQRCFQNLTKFTGKQSETYNIIKKETPAQIFFCEFCKIFQNNFL